MAEWQSIELADSDTLEDLAKIGTEAVTKINTALDVIKGGAEVGKLFLLTSINPLAVAIVLAADEMIGVFSQYKESGVSILIIDTTNPQTGRKQENKLGLKMKRDNVGIVFEDSIPHPQPPPLAIAGVYVVNDKYRETLNLADLNNYRDKNGKLKTDKGFIPPIPKLEKPYKFVQGGYDPATWTGTIDTVPQSEGISTNTLGLKVNIPGIPFPELPADQTIEMMAAAFEDEGDIPKYRIKPEVVKNPKQKYFDVTGESVTFDAGSEASATSYNLTSQDKQRDLRLELYASGNTKIATTERGILTTRIATGRPEYTGDTGRTEFQVSALAIVIAAQNPLEFVESLSSLINALLPDETALMESLAALKASLNYFEQNLTIRVDSKYGDFVEGDFVIGEKSGCAGIIKSIESIEDSVMTSVILDTNQRDPRSRSQEPQPPLEIIEKVIDKNPDGRFKDVELIWEPRGDAQPFGKFDPRENVFEATEVKTQYEINGKSQDHYTYIKKVPPAGWESNILFGQSVSIGVLPKYGAVVTQSPIAEASTAPNFSSAKLAQMIPGYGKFWDDMINLAEKLKAFAEGVLATIQKLIDVIDKAVEFFEELAENIIALIELLTKGIPNAGIWFMGMNTTTGNIGLASGLRNAGNAPDESYTFSGGILLVGPVLTGGQTEDMNRKLWELLGIEFQSV